METGMTQDAIDALLGLTASTPLYGIRHARDKVVAATQASYAGYFAPELSQFNRSQRLQIARLGSELASSPRLTKHYTALLERDDAEGGASDIAMQAASRFARVLSTRPIDGDRQLLMSLPAAGIETASIVALAQLLAFISYQARVVEGLRAMQAAGAGPAAATAPNNTNSGTLALGSPIQIAGFTNASLEWKSWLDLVDTAHASAEQLAVLKESHPKAMTSDYYLVLVHQAELLKQRSIAFNAIMYAPGGLSRAERELAATVVSRINGCVYCASVHAQRFEQLCKRNDAILQVFDNPYLVSTSLRDKAIAEFSIALTLQPNQVNANSIQALYDAGLDAAEVLDLVHSVAIFAWANRLMLNLGEPLI
jgi:uncharacterized peroxidase-related enzyme